MSIVFLFILFACLFLCDLFSFHLFIVRKTKWNKNSVLSKQNFNNNFFIHKIDFFFFFFQQNKTACSGQNRKHIHQFQLKWVNWTDKIHAKIKKKNNNNRKSIMCEQRSYRIVSYSRWYLLPKAIGSHCVC